MNTVAWITSKNEQYDIKDIEARKTKLNIEDLPKNLSAFSNDMGFIDNTVNNLINYYKKSEIYTKTEIDQKLSAKWDSKFVDKLPTEDISTTTIYFLRRKKEQGTTQYDSDVYDEYIYVDGTWELIGNTYVDLTDYYTKSQTESKIDEKVSIETQNRILADNTLQNNIDDVQTNIDDVNNSLNSEITTRQNKDLSHETKMTEIESNLNSEISRATNAENNLSNRCDSYDSHVSNTENPHNVTAEQVGLGNVTNVSTTSTITPDSEKNITSGAVYTALENKVDKIDGRGLSEQNFTYAEKTKLAGLENYDDTSIQSRISANENAITTLNGDTSVSGSVDKKIADAIAGITQIDFKIVSELPSAGLKGTIYLIRGTGTGTTQQYDEYIWLDNKWEQLGKSTIEVDLSDVYSKSEVNALVSVKNDKITITDDSSTALTDADTFSTTGNTGTNPTNLTKRPLSLLWNYIKSKISSVLGLTATAYGGKASTAGTADKTVNALTINGKTYDGSTAVDAGVQTVANGGTGVTTQADINKAFIGNLEEGNSDVTDGTEFVSSWASDNGFAETAEGANKPYKRKFSKVWNYIKDKISSVLGLTANNYGGKARTAGTADKTVNDISIDIPYAGESGQYVIPLGNILQPGSAENNSPYNWDITGFFSIIRPTGHNGSHLYFEAGHGYSHEWTTYAYLDKLDFRGVTPSIKAFQYNGKWWLGLCIITYNQGYASKMTITYSRGLPATPTCILYNSRSDGVANEEIYNSIQDIPSSWWKTRTIHNPTTFTQNITAPNITSLEQRVAALESKI